MISPVRCAATFEGGTQLDLSCSEMGTEIKIIYFPQDCSFNQGRAFQGAVCTLLSCLGKQLLFWKLSPVGQCCLSVIRTRGPCVKVNIKYNQRDCCLPDVMFNVSAETAWNRKKIFLKIISVRPKGRMVFTDTRIKYKIVQVFRITVLSNQLMC